MKQYLDLQYYHTQPAPPTAQGKTSASLWQFLVQCRPTHRRVSVVSPARVVYSIHCTSTHVSSKEVQLNTTFTKGLGSQGKPVPSPVGALPRVVGFGVGPVGPVGLVRLVGPLVLVGPVGPVVVGGDEGLVVWREIV